jgi:hypothetical protein
MDVRLGVRELAVALVAEAWVRSEEGGEALAGASSETAMDAAARAFANAPEAQAVTRVEPAVAEP